MGNRFGQINDAGGYDSFDFDSPLRATFTTPIASVTVRFDLDNTSQFFTGFGTVEAYGPGGLIGTMSTTAGGPGGDIMFTDSSITHILAYIGGDLFGADFTGITLLQFDPLTNSTPDGGSTVALLGLAIAGLGVLSRKANRA